MRDRLLTASAADGTISLVAGITTALVAETRARHGLATTATAAVGRLATAAALLGTSLKGPERISIHIRCDGPIGGLSAEVMTLPEDAVGVRAYARNPEADVPLKPSGKLDVGAVVGAGKLQLTKSYEIGQPYNGIVELVSGEIGDDLAAYMATSQQIPSVVALGVLVDSSGVRAAGGLIAQVLPGADDATIALLERNVSDMPPITSQIDAGADPERIIATACAGLVPKHLAEYGVHFACRCSREKVETALLGLGYNEIVKIAREQPSTEATCDFCRQNYVLTSAELNDLAARMERG